MNVSHYRLPAELVQLIAARLRSISQPEKTDFPDIRADLSNPQLADILAAIIGTEERAIPTAELDSTCLTLEEQSIKDHLLKEIRMRPVKSTLKSPQHQEEALARTG